MAFIQYEENTADPATADSSVGNLVEVGLDGAIGGGDDNTWFTVSELDASVGFQCG